MSELNALMEKYSQVKLKIKSFKELQENLRTHILVFLKINNLDYYEDDNNTLELTSNKRRSFNKDMAIQFITDKGGDANEFFTESDYETLKVKSKELNSGGGLK